MGAACCVAARDKNIVGRSSSEILHRNIRYSPTWSLRWDNRARVAGTETSIPWFSDVNNRNYQSEVKYESAHASGDGGPIVNFQRCRQKSPTMSESTSAQARTPVSDQCVSRTISMDTSLEQAKSSREFPTVSDRSAMGLSFSLPSTSSVTSPVSSESYLLPASLTTPSLPHHSSGHQLIVQRSESLISEGKSSDNFAVPEYRSENPSWSNESTRGSHGGSSDGQFSGLLATSHSKQWSVDSDSSGFNHVKTRSSSCISTSRSVDLQTCGICTKLLTERSLWSSQKLVSSNELSVVAVLTCGHVYHSECLEAMTPEIHKYDPSCPVCTLGEKQTHKISQKAFKAEFSMKAKTKRSSYGSTDGSLDGDSIMFDCIKGGRFEEEGPKRTSSFSAKSLLVKPFLKRHFSFGSKDNKPSMENHWSKKKGFFWTRSLKI